MTQSVEKPLESASKIYKRSHNSGFGLSWSKKVVSAAVGKGPGRKKIGRKSDEKARMGLIVGRSKVSTKAVGEMLREINGKGRMSLEDCPRKRGKIMGRSIPRTSFLQRAR